MQGFPHSYEQRIDEGGAVGRGHPEHVDVDRYGRTMKALPNAMKLRERARSGVSSPMKPEPRCLVPLTTESPVF